MQKPAIVLTLALFVLAPSANAEELARTNAETTATIQVGGTSPTDLAADSTAEAAIVAAQNRTPTLQAETGSLSMGRGDKPDLLPTPVVEMASRGGLQCPSEFFQANSCSDCATARKRCYNDDVLPDLDCYACYEVCLGLEGCFIP